MLHRIIIVLVVLAFSVVGVGVPLLPHLQPTQTFADGSPVEPLDINSAKADELKALPGIGDAYSERIIKNRPYKRKDELVHRKIIPQATYDSIKDQIIARQ